MKLRIDRTPAIFFAIFIFCCLCCETRAQLACSNPLEYAATIEGNEMINKQVKNQISDKEKTAGYQVTIAGEFTKMKSWEKKYNSYLKTTCGYASSLKACTNLYNDGVLIFIDLCKIGKAIKKNPQGIAATISMNNLYLETATEFASVYTTLKEAVAKGGTENMLTGAERSKTLWELNDKMEALEKDLSKLHLSLRYYTMSDVWNSATAGMIDRSTGEIAKESFKRWRRCSYVGSTKH